MKNKLIKISFLSFLSLFLAFSVYAQENSDSINLDQNENTREINLGQEIKEKKEEINQEIKEENRETKQEIQNIREDWQNANFLIEKNKNLLQTSLDGLKFKNIAPEQKEEIKRELKEKREQVQKEIKNLRQENLEKEKELRQNLKFNISDLKTRTKVSAAYGKGLKMINRYRAVTYRFKNIIDRIESRVQKMEKQGIDISEIIPLIEEAKNINTLNELKLEEMKEKYSLLLEGKNLEEISKQSRQIAEEIKKENESLNSKLKEIISLMKNLLEKTNNQPEK